MNDKDLKAKLSKLAKAIGHKRVIFALVDEGMSLRQAERLSLGDHEGKFRRKTVAAVEAVLTKQRQGPKAS